MSKWIILIKKDSWRGCHERCHKTMLSTRQCAWANARYYVIIIFMFYLLNLIRKKPIQLFDVVGPGIVCYLYIAHVTITMHHHNTNNWPNSVQPWWKYISIFIFFRCDLPVFEIKINEEIKFNNALGSIEWPNIFTYINILNYLNCKLWFDFLGNTKLHKTNDIFENFYICFVGCFRRCCCCDVVRFRIEFKVLWALNR